MACSRFSIFGANGFIGKRLVSKLSQEGYEVVCILRDYWPKKGADLGHVIFTIGMTAQFRGRPFETLETQVIRLYEALNNYRYESFLYLSSTRLYQGAAATSEQSILAFRPTEQGYIYNLTKATAECLCLSINNPAIRIVRLSNVFGTENESKAFIADVIREAVTTGGVILRSAPDSAKDYIDVREVVELLMAIALGGQHRIYNLATGANTSNDQIACALKAEGFEVTFIEDAPVLAFPQIDIRRLESEFFRPKSTLVSELPELINAAKKAYGV